MLKRTWSLLLVTALVAAAPGSAYAVDPDRVMLDHERGVVERVWEGVLRLIGVDGDDFTDRSPTQREPEAPRSVSGADEAGGGIDPNG